MYRYSFLLLFTVYSFPGYSQITISGPTCAAPGVTYQYLISGVDTSTTLQICVTGGIVGSGANACQAGTKIPYVVIVWNGNVSSASINITSAAGNGNMNVSVMQLLQGGQIDKLTGMQTVGYDSVPSIINCSLASGGNCQTNYSYQWQSSLDNVSWSDVRGATGQNLIVPSTLKLTTFFRRKVTETGTGSIGYSDAATVFVNAPAAGIH